MSEDEYEYEDYEEGWVDITVMDFTQTTIAFSEEDEYENEEDIKENQNNMYFFLVKCILFSKSIS